MAAIALVLTLLLTLIVLALMREVVILRGDIRALVQTVTGASLAPTLAPSAPQPLLRDVQEAKHDFDEELVVFLSEHCSGCDELVDALHELALDGGFTAVVRGRATPEFKGRLVAAAGRVIDDARGRVFTGMGVTATPTAVIVDRPGGEIVDFSVGANRTWINQWARRRAVVAT